jgi:hypothetical protein
MTQKYRATFSRDPIKPGKPAAIIAFKDSVGGRWEFSGTMPLTLVHTIQALAATNGRCSSLIAGRDDAIEAAFST